MIAGLLPGAMVLLFIENYLEQCIQSVLNQTQKEIEIILVDKEEISS